VNQAETCFSFRPVPSTEQHRTGQLKRSERVRFPSHVQLGFFSVDFLGASARFSDYFWNRSSPSACGQDLFARFRSSASARVFPVQEQTSRECKQSRQEIISRSRVWRPEITSSHGAFLLRVPCLTVVFCIVLFTSTVSGVQANFCGSWGELVQELVSIFY
jgi:hypothetical protein